MSVSFASLDEVKNSPALQKLREITSTPYDDEYLEQALQGFTDRFETMTGRKVEYGTHTEIFTIHDCQRSVQLRGLPIESITSVKQSYTGDFSGTALDTGQYSVDTESGIIRLRYGDFIAGAGTVQVIYVGGLKAIPAELRMAAILQVAHEYRSVPTTHLMSQGQQNGSASYRPLDLLPMVLRTFHLYAVRS